MRNIAEGIVLDEAVRTRVFDTEAHVDRLDDVAPDNRSRGLAD